MFSGAVYQPVLNHLTGRPLDYGIKDYDLGYTARATRPPGFITRRTFAKAVAGSLKNMTPNRENDRSKLLGQPAYPSAPGYGFQSPPPYSPYSGSGYRNPVAGYSGDRPSEDWLPGAGYAIEPAS